MHHCLRGYGRPWARRRYNVVEILSIPLSQLSLSLSFCLSVCLSVCLSLSLCLSLCLSLFLARSRSRCLPFTFRLGKCVLLGPRLLIEEQRPGNVAVLSVDHQSFSITRILRLCIC